MLKYVLSDHFPIEVSTFFYPFLLTSLHSPHFSIEISNFWSLYFWHLYFSWLSHRNFYFCHFLITFLLNLYFPLLCNRFSMEISTFYSLSCWNPSFLFTFLSKSRLSLHFHINMSRPGHFEPTVIRHLAICNCIFECAPLPPPTQSIALSTRHHLHTLSPPF